MRICVYIYIYYWIDEMFLSNEICYFSEMSIDVIILLFIFFLIIPPVIKKHFNKYDESKELRELLKITN